MHRTLQHRLRALPADHPDLQAARGTFALTLRSLGDLVGARVLQEQVLDVCSRTLPNDHLEVQKASGNLAVTLKAMGDLHGARERLEQVVGVLGRTVLPDHPDLQIARSNLAMTLRMLGDLPRARSLQEQVLAISSRSLPAGHPDVLRAKLNLGVTMKALGDLGSARALFEQVLDARSSALPDDHPELQTARANLASTLKALGDLPKARALEEQVLSVFSRSLPPDHPDRQRIRLQLAITLYQQGELRGALALQESALEVLTRTLPDAHPDLQDARASLALTSRALGDLHQARTLQEHVLAIQSRVLPADHRDVQAARANLAATLMELGDLVAARALFEEVLAVVSRTRPSDHPDVQTARTGLAHILRVHGDLARARELYEQVFEVYTRTMPSDHPGLLATRDALAVLLRDSGDLQAARMHFEEVLATRTLALPEDHPDLQASREHLADLLWSVGDPEVALELQERVLANETRSLPDGHPRLVHTLHLLADLIWSIGDDPAFENRANDFMHCLGQALEHAATSQPPREVDAFAASQWHHISLAAEFGARRPGLAASAFELIEGARAAGVVSAALARNARRDAGLQQLHDDARRASVKVVNLVRAGTKHEELTAAIRERDRIQGELVQRAERKGSVIVSPTVAALCGVLEPDAVMVGYWTYDLHDRGPEDRDAPRGSTNRMLAFVLKPDRSIAQVDLGLVSAIAKATEQWRAAVLAQTERGLSPEANESREDAQSAAGEDVRQLVFDPLVPLLGSARRLIIAADGVLHSIPLDALPSGDALLGDRYAIDLRHALRDELLEPASFDGMGVLLTVGGASFNQVPRSSAAAEAARPTDGRSQHGSNVWNRVFEPLTHTGAEARGVAALFEESIPDSMDPERVQVLEKREASVDLVERWAPRARWLHIATHGWFAPEAVRSWGDVTNHTPLMTAEQMVRGASPMVLCGLALAGANLPPDELGRSQGLITAEEVAGWDLSNCELAVLSACDTNVGIRRAGQVVASLQKALHMAGARSVITSLWKVPDEATKDLMLDFYRRLWVEKKPKRQALWEAKMRIRAAKDESGAPRYATRDWAAWVLTGDPE